ncbi:MAG TPA: hypothetical protein VMH86_03890 [Rhizomicrobium sp.]|nr:hypothetical protein [Rhizomicrobium sp.]
MDQDDLPPHGGAPQEYTASGSLGWWVGVLVWLAIFAGAAAGAIYFLAHWHS